MADLGAEIVLLDVAADRYFQLCGEIADHLRRRATGEAPHDPGLLERLREAGVLVDTPESKPVTFLTLPACAASALEQAEPVAPVVRWRCAALLVGARLQLSALGLSRVLARLRAQRAAPMRSDSDSAAALARGFAQARAWLPGSRKCLPDSIALLDLLTRHRLSGRLVIGVRTAPFAAHAWVECDGAVLSDTLDTVAELTPILSL